MTWLVVWLAGASVIWTVGGVWMGVMVEEVDPDAVALLAIVGLVWPFLVIVAVLALPFVAAFHFGRWVAR